MNDATINKFIIPQKLVKLGPFDLIIIDGLSGFNPDKPGRLILYYWVSKLSKKGTIIYRDDFDRKLEKYCVNNFKDKDKQIFFR